MSGFYYLFTKLGGVRLLEGARLTDRFENPPTFAEVGPDIGPGGLGGILFYDGGVIPKGINWHASILRDGNQPAFYVGWHPLAKPGPADIERTVTLSGFKVKLRDSNEWLIPLVLPCVALDPVRKPGIPCEPVNDDGAIMWRPLAKYAGLIHDAQRALDYALDNSLPKIDPTEFCAALLNCGYRIGLDEMLAMQLIDSDSASKMVLASLDCLSDNGGPGERYMAGILAEAPEVADVFAGA